LTDDSIDAGRGIPAPESVAIGSTLTAARETRGMSVEDVAAATRIRATLVRSIEADDFSRCGGAVYARGHIKSIAAVVGTDPRRLVAEFDRTYGNPAPTVQSSPLPTFSPPAGTRRPRARWASVAVAVLAVGVVFLAFSWVLGRGQGTDDVSASPGGGPPTPAPTTSTPSSSAPTTAKPSPPPPKPTPSGVRLRVLASGGESWLSVRSSAGAEIFRGTLGPGQQKDFADGRSLKVRYGNSRAIMLTVNGQSVGRPQCTSIVCDAEYLPPHATEG
jgi:cytoskeleton protein RodZ